MKFLLFNNGILISDGDKDCLVNRENNFKDILGPTEEVRVCVVDVDVLIAAAIESPIEKKDSHLVRKFKEMYPHESYIIQDERIDNNLFQIIGIKEQKVREVYSLISSDSVDVFIPYGIALRNTLIKKNIDLNKTIVFVDDLGKEKLLTVIDGLKFSRTRVITNSGEDILPEIKRSQIDFFKKNEEFLNKRSSDILILINDQDLTKQIISNEENLSVEYFDVKYPALEGLKDIHTPIKYRLPEEILKKRREIELKRNVLTAMVSLSIIGMGGFYLLINKLEYGAIEHQYDLARISNEQLNGQLTILDRETYREDLRRNKVLNYGVSYLSILDLIPTSYEVGSFKFTRSDVWDLELSLSVENGEAFDPIPKVGVLRNADVKDVFVNNQAGKHLRIIL